MITLYHGTSKSIGDKILKCGYINPYTYFSKSKEMALYYASMRSRQTSLFQVEVDDSDINTNFYVQDYFQNKCHLKTFKKIK